MIVDGKKIAGELIATLALTRKEFKPVLKLGVVMGADDPSIQSFVRIKERVADALRVVVVREPLPKNAATQDALGALKRLTKSTDGVIVQLPLPKNIDTDKVLAAVPPGCDVDAISTHSGSLVQSPVVEAISQVFVRAGVSARGKRAVVVGAGRLVGAPVAAWLRSLGAHTTIVTHSRGSLEDLHDADIVVLGAGEPGLVTPEMLKEGVVLIDAGMSEMGGRVIGDADPSCAHVASVFTPVPSGIGPIAVAMIFKNLFTLAGRK